MPIAGCSGWARATIAYACVSQPTAPRNSSRFPRSCRSGPNLIVVSKRWRAEMSMTAAEILQKMISEGSQIAVLRGPTPEYKELISVCRGDGVAACTLSREILNEPDRS